MSARCSTSWTVLHVVGKVHAAQAAGIPFGTKSADETGFKNVIRTTSGKFQARLFVKELNRQRPLGSFATANEAAAALAKAMADGHQWREPLIQRAKRGTVRIGSNPSPQNLHDLTASACLSVSGICAGAFEC